MSAGEQQGIKTKDIQQVKFHKFHLILGNRKKVVLIMYKQMKSY